MKKVLSSIVAAIVTLSFSTLIFAADAPPAPAVDSVTPAAADVKKDAGTEKSSEKITCNCCNKGEKKDEKKKRLRLQSNPDLICPDREQMKATACSWIDRLSLIRHPEGGWFRETYRSAEAVTACALPERFGGERSLATAIYFLLEAGEFSAFHRIKSDEMWHAYAGDALTVHVIDPNGEYRTLRLGSDPDRGESFQAVVPAGCWFAAETEGEYSLVGCTVSPGFAFEDFEMAERGALAARYSRHLQLITQFTR